MKIKRNLENILQDSAYAASPLPPLWQVIYQEAVRCNHLLFDKDDVVKFERDQSSFPVGQSDALATTMVELFSCHDLSSLKALIQQLPYRKRCQVFQIYLRFLESWRYQLRQSLN